MNEFKITWALLLFAAVIFTATKTITLDTLWICLSVAMIGLQVVVMGSKRDE